MKFLTKKMPNQEVPNPKVVSKKMPNQKTPQQQPLPKKNIGKKMPQQKQPPNNSPAENADISENTMPLKSHLVELRRRLMVGAGVIIAGFAVCFYFKEILFELLTAPLVAAQGGQGAMIFTGVAEFFFTYLKLAFLGGLFIGLPIFLWEMWKFTAPALYKNERAIALPFIIATPLLFYAGGAFTYFFVMPLVVSFFFQFQTDMVTAMPSVKEYLTFFTKMVFAFGLAFEMPVALLILARFGIVTASSLRSFRRYAVVVIFVAAAVLTPPDPASQLLLAVPLLLLYELSILGAVFMQQKYKTIQ